MNEKLLKMLEAFGVTFKEGETKLDETMLNQLAEKWDATVQTIKDSVEPLKTAEGEPALSVGSLVFPEEYMKREFGRALTSDEFEKFAKEGIAYHKQVVEDAIAMGVKAQGNDFPAETWKNTFATMGTAAIKDIAKTFQRQAEGAIGTGRLSDPQAGSEPQKASIPDEAFKVGK